MRAVVTRVSSASVTIEGHINGEIGKGFLVLLGVGPQDDEAVCDKLAEKICNLRIWEKSIPPVDPCEILSIPVFPSAIGYQCYSAPFASCSAAILFFISAISGKYFFNG